MLAVRSIGLINMHYLLKQTGLVLWIVPSTQIYNQTLAALRDRAHPYRVQLNLASGDRTMILEKNAVFNPEDVENNLIVLLLMLPAANRQAKETLRLFRDRSGFEAFLPGEDEYPAHQRLLEHVGNLDYFHDPRAEEQRLVKSSLGNVLRVLRPLIVVDEGHKTYGELAQKTLVGFNPSFILELSATPPAASNKLVNISGQQLLREGMIKLDINVHSSASADWRDTLVASHQRREQLERVARDYEQETGTYIRPICLIQVERTGAKQLKSGFIHAEDVRNYLIRTCGVPKEQVAVKSSEQDEIESLDILSPDVPIRYIITRQALQEGWDCPFAYILVVLTNPRDAKVSITQLVGRVLRQPYARKTGRKELDESYVYCYRDTAGELIRAVRNGLQEEGLGDVAGRVVSERERSGALQEIRPQYTDYAGRIFLPCFVVRDEISKQWREVSYEMDVLAHLDWQALAVDFLESLQLNPTETQDIDIAVGLQGAVTPVRASIAKDGEANLTFVARQLTDLVLNPWRAYELAEAAIDRLKKRYDDGVINRNIPLILDELRRRLLEQRVKQRAAPLTT